jgi:hypothetical protein
MMIVFALLLAANTTDPAPQAIRLEPGDYRWIPFTVKQVPTEVDCRFEVLQGGASVHMELLPMTEFRAFNRGKAHETLAVSPNSASGAFRRIIDREGQYAVVLKNEAGAPAVTVSLEVHTDLNPNANVTAQELPPRKRLIVILVSFAIFLLLVSLSGLRLLRGIRSER